MFGNLGEREREREILVFCLWKVFCACVCRCPARNHPPPQLDNAMPWAGRADKATQRCSEKSRVRYHSQHPAHCSDGKCESACLKGRWSVVGGGGVGGGGCVQLMALDTRHGFVRTHGQHRGAPQTRKGCDCDLQREWAHSVSERVSWSDEQRKDVVSVVVSVRPAEDHRLLATH